MFRINKVLSNQKGSYKPFVLGFLVVGFLSATTFYGISTFDEDVKKMADEAIQSNNQNGGEETLTNSKESPPMIVEKDDLILKPDNPLHYIPTFVMQNDHIEIEGESLRIVSNFDAVTFLNSVSEKMDLSKSVTVTELESNESQAQNSKSMILRQYNLNYAELLVEKSVQEKVGDDEAVMVEKMVANKNAILHDTLNQSNASSKTTTSFGDNKMNKENLVEKTALFDSKRSPYHLIKDFSNSVLPVGEYIIADNDTTVVFFKESKSVEGSSTNFAIEAYWFDKNASVPTRAIKYETTLKDGMHNYKLEEYVYDDWDSAPAINLPESLSQNSN